MREDGIEEKGRTRILISNFGQGQEAQERVKSIHFLQHSI